MSRSCVFTTLLSSPPNVLWWGERCNLAMMMMFSSCWWWSPRPSSPIVWLLFIFSISGLNLSIVKLSPPPASYDHRGPSIINRLGHPNFIVASIRKIVESSRSSVSCVARCLLSWNYFQDKFLCPLSTTLDSLIKYSFNYFLNIINFVLWVVLCACLRVCGCWSPKSLSQSSSSSSCFGSTQNILSLPLSTILIVAN